MRKLIKALLLTAATVLTLGAFAACGGEDGHEHAYGDWSLSVTPTATTEGELSRVCAEDENHVQTVSVPVLTEEYYEISTTTEADCVTPEETVYTYKGEDLLLNGQPLSITVTGETDDTKHAYGDWSIGLAPTEEAEGYLVRACSRSAEHEEKVTLPAVNTEEYSIKSTTASTCMVAGVRTYEWKNTDYTLAEGAKVRVEIELPLAEHDYSDWTFLMTYDGKQPTLVSEGQVVQYCKTNENHEKRVKVLPALNEEDYTISERTEPTCTSSGGMRYTLKETLMIYNQHTGKYSQCSIWLFKAINSDAHKYPDTWTRETAPTETTTGTLYRDCQNVGYSSQASHRDTYELPVLGTEYYDIVDEKASTCGEQGFVTYRLKDETIVLTGGNRPEYTVKTPLLTEHTYEDESLLYYGTKWYRECSVCYDLQAVEDTTGYSFRIYSADDFALAYGKDLVLCRALTVTFASMQAYLEAIPEGGKAVIDLAGYTISVLNEDIDAIIAESGKTVEIINGTAEAE